MLGSNTCTSSPAIDRKFGSYRGFLIRAGLNTLILVATMAFFPLIAGNGGGEAWVLICSFLIGVFGGMACKGSATTALLTLTVAD